MTKTTLDEAVIKLLAGNLEEALKVKLSPKDVPNTPGHYVIYKNGVAIYNGTTSVSMKNRVSTHLFRKNKYTATSGIAIESITAKEFAEAVAEGLIKEKDTNYYKTDKDTGDRYLNGININDYPNDVFEISVIETDYFGDAYESVFREIYGKPSCCQYTNR